jgi:antitoxin YefM
MSIAATDARACLVDLIHRVNSDQAVIEITSKHDSAALMSKLECDSILETAYLLGSPKNARRLLDAIEQVRRSH